jgi:hypothetical protein
MGDYLYQNNAFYSIKLWKVTRQQKKIPNHKHQIPNKSQIPIPNDQNIHSSQHLSLRKGCPAGNFVIWHKIRLTPSDKNAWVSGVWNFEFWLLGFVCYLEFVICYFSMTG